MEAFCPRTPNHLNQSCYLQQIKSFGLHNTNLPMQSFTCYHVLPLRGLSPRAFLESKFPSSLPSLHPAPLQWYLHCCFHFIAILPQMVFASFFLYIFSWLNCENGLDKGKSEVASSRVLRKTKDIKGIKRGVIHLCPPVHPNNYKPRILTELLQLVFPGSQRGRRQISNPHSSA